MTHLTPDELVDIAEGTRPESSSPHLAACTTCRAHVVELRALAAAVAEVEVPEPSPLFWDHFSRRVREAVAEEGREGAAARLKRAFATFLGLRYAAAAFAAVCAVLFVVSGTRLLSPPAVERAFSQAVPPPAAADSNTSTGITGDAAIDDPSLTLMASLTATLDDAEAEAGLTGALTSEHAVTHMNDAELRELGRLLQQEIGRPGA